MEKPMVRNENGGVGGHKVWISRPLTTFLFT